jgi:hypothetical protein
VRTFRKKIWDVLGKNISKGESEAVHPRTDNTMAKINSSIKHNTKN